ncbi:hypothetical protein EMCRGX_G016628 [Ephydatia muelleri]
MDCGSLILDAPQIATIDGKLTIYRCSGDCHKNYICVFIFLAACFACLGLRRLHHQAARAVEVNNKLNTGPSWQHVDVILSGHHSLFIYVPLCFPDITNCTVECRKLSSGPYPTSRDQLVQWLCKGVLLDVFFAGYLQGYGHNSKVKVIELVLTEVVYRKHSTCLDGAGN